MKIAFFLIILRIIPAKCDYKDDFIASSPLFAASVYRELLKDGEDCFVVSPSSAQIVLTVLQLESYADTSEELRFAIRIPRNRSVTEHVLRRLCNYLSNHGNYTFDLGLKAFAKKTSFLPGVVDVDFSKREETATKINSWAQGVTKKTIRKPVKESCLTPDTKQILMNAMYVQGQWPKRFSTGKPPKDEFGYMESNGTFDVAINDELGAMFLRVPFVGENATMTFVFPSKNRPLADVDNVIERVLIPQNYKNQNIAAQIPRFRIFSKIDYSRIIQNLGVRKAFTKEAEFSIKGAVVDHAIQKSFIQIGKSGVEASVTTTIEIGTKHEHRFLKLHSLRSFVFFIQIKDVIVFLGRYFDKKGQHIEGDDELEESMEVVCVNKTKHRN